MKKKILEEHELRQARWERLKFALDGEPDPGFEHGKASVDTREFDKVGEELPYAKDAKGIEEK